MNNTSINLADEEELPTIIETNQLIEVLKTKGITLGKSPKRTLTYWRQQGLISRPIVSRRGAKFGTLSFYPIETVKAIEFIREMQRKGHTLGEIRMELTPLDRDWRDEWLGLMVVPHGPRYAGQIDDILDKLGRDVFERIVKPMIEKRTEEAFNEGFKKAQKTWYKWLEPRELEKHGWRRDA